MSDESSNNDGATESSSDSAKESSPEASDASEEREARKANARAVGVDTAFLDALGDEFADAPAPAGKYGPGGTLVAEDADEAAAVTGLPKTKLPPPPPGLSSKKERDEVLKKDFLQETTPTLELEGKDDGEVLFESAAVGGSGSERLDLKSGANPVVPDGDDGLPDVLASFDSEASDPGSSGNDLVVSVGEMPKAEEVSPEAADDAAEPESEEEAKDDDDAKPVVAAKPESKSEAKPGPKSEPKSEPESEPKKAVVAAPAASGPAANDGPDIQKYAVIGIAVLLLLLGGYALMSKGDKPKSGEVAQAGAAGKDKAAPAADGADGAADGGGGAGGGGAGGAGADGAGGGGGGDADGADEGSTPAAADGGADGGAEEGAEEAVDSGGADAEAATATDAEQAAAEGGDTEGVAEASTGDVDIAIDDDGGDDEGGGGGGGGVAPISGNADKKKERAAEDEMTAKELRDAAKAALKKRKYGEAYRLSGKAIRKESTEPAHAIRVEAACGMKNQAAAKSAFERINTGKVKRDLRSACRDHDVRLGL